MPNVPMHMQLHENQEEKETEEEGKEEEEEEVVEEEAEEDEMAHQINNLAEEISNIQNAIKGESSEEQIYSLQQLKRNLESLLASTYLDG